MSANKKILLAKLFFNGNIRRKTWRKLAAQIQYDVSIARSINLMHDRYVEQKSPLAPMFASILRSLDDGNHLDVAFAPFIPVEETMLIRGGLKSGRVSEAFTLCSAIIEARQKIINSLVEAISYPALLLSMFGILLVTLSLYVVPELSALSNPESWQGGAKILYSVASAVASPFGGGVLFLLVVGFIAAMFSLSLWTGKARLWVESMAPWSFYRLVMGSIWLFTVATLMRAGIQLDHILTDMLDGGNLSAWMRERVLILQFEYSKGVNFGKALSNTGLNFPDKELVDDLAVYATLPNFDNRLHELAKEWLQEGTAKIAGQARTLNALAICGMIALLAGLALAVSSLQQQLNMGF